MFEQTIEDYDLKERLKQQLDNIDAVADVRLQHSLKYRRQRAYNEYLINCIHNREVGDYVNGHFLSAGKDYALKFNANDKKIEPKYLFGYNFNHTGSPCYLAYQNKINTLKVQRIIKEYKLFYENDCYYFVTLTMPSIEIIDNKSIAEQSNYARKIKEYSNNVINNLIKKIMKEYNVRGVVKKFECTYAEKNNKTTAHPHYHLLIAVDNKYKNLMVKDFGKKLSMKTTIFEYWYQSFIVKKFPGTLRRDALAAFDIRKANNKKLAAEIAGYISKGPKEDYLSSQLIFDHYYLFFYNTRLITFVGEFKEINTKLRLDDLDDRDEEDINDLIVRLEEEDTAKYTHIVFYNYNFNGFAPMKFAALVPGEKDSS